MTRKELECLEVNQKVKMFHLNLNSKIGYEYLSGVVKKVYRNYQLQIQFDREPTPRIVGYSQVEIV